MPRPAPRVTPAEPFERATRISARIAALALALTVLLPRLWRDDAGVLHCAWFWDRSGPAWFEWGWFGELQTSVLTLLLVLGAMSWGWASLLPLARRGRWLVVPTLVCLTLRWAAWLESPIYVQPAAHPWLVAATVSLLLARVPGHEQLAKRLAVLAGTVLLAHLYWPGRDWEVGAWAVLVESAASDDLSAALFRFVVAYSTVMGGLLIWLGLARSGARLARRLVVTTLPLLVLLNVLVFVVLCHEVAFTRTGDLSINVWNALRIGLRPYALILLLTVGIFAWIVGAGGKRDLVTVFE